MSRKTDLLSAYFFNRRTYLERDLQQLQENLRYRSVSSVDCLELIIARERLELFIEVSRDIMHILGIKSGIPP